MAIDTSYLNQLISDFRTISQKDSITPDSLGALLKRIADLLNLGAKDLDLTELRNALNTLKAAYRDMGADVSTLQGEASSALKKIGKAEEDIEKLKKAEGGSGRGFIYVDIEHNEYLRVLGADNYLNKDYVPFLFRYSTKQNRYKPKSLPKNAYEHKRKGWHPMGQEGTAIVDADSKILSIDRSVFCGSEHGISCLPQDFIRWEFGDDHVYYGQRYVRLTKSKDGKVVNRRVRLKYGIAFMPREAIEPGKRLDLSKLATNIATFHITWDKGVAQGGWGWMFNK